MSWSKDKKGQWVWKPDGKGNPNKPGDNTSPPPSFDLGGTGAGSGGSSPDSVYTVEVGFGLTDEKTGKPLALPPIQIGSYVTGLAGKNPAAYSRIKSAVAALTGRKRLDPTYVGNYVSKLAQNIMGSSDILAKSGNLEDYFTTALKTAGGGTQQSLPQSYVSSESQAKGDINKLFSQLVGRQATDKELKALTKVLNEAQKNNPSRYVNGVTYGGLDKEQFLTDLITTGVYEANPKAYPGILANIAKESSEYQQNVAQQGIFKVEDALKTVAENNDISLSQDQLDAYKARIAAGEGVDIVKNDIRKLAAIGQPDTIKKMIESGTDLSTIYSPYRSIMGSVLEVNPNTIPLNDPTLRMAIGPDKEMSLYEYQRALRKDPRWEYTNQARSETADAITTVLKDFGFMG